MDVKHGEFGLLKSGISHPGHYKGNKCIKYCSNIKFYNGAWREGTCKGNVISDVGTKNQKF